METEKALEVHGNHTTIEERTTELIQFVQYGDNETECSLLATS